MLLGKRPRPPIMKRTTSMSGGMAVHTQTTNLEAQIQAQAQAHDQIILISDSEDNIKDPIQHQGRLLPHHLSPTTTNNHPHTHNNNPSHLIHTPHFLRTCGLCNSRLAPGRDIYMYRGDTAFCSLECREQQMKQDERKEKWKMASNKEEHRRASPPSTAKASTKTETAACT